MHLLIGGHPVLFVSKTLLQNLGWTKNTKSQLFLDFLFYLDFVHECFHGVQSLCEILWICIVYKFRSNQRVLGGPSTHHKDHLKLWHNRKEDGSRVYIEN